MDRLEALATVVHKFCNEAEVIVGGKISDPLRLLIMEKLDRSNDTALVERVARIQGKAAEQPAPELKENE